MESSSEEGSTVVKTWLLERVLGLPAAKSVGINKGVMGNRKDFFVVHHHCWLPPHFRDFQAKGNASQIRHRECGRRGGT